MEMSHRELWTAIHGMLFGAGFLLAFAGGFTGLWVLRSQWLTPDGAARVTRRLIPATWLMTILAWAAVLIGTYLIYPWYRAKPPAGSTILADYPKYLLISRPQTAELHNFGMEWKEHIAWLCPLLATAVAFVVTRYGAQIATDANLRRALLFLYSAAFFSASIAGLFGALLNKAAPTR